jgi:hypothetical protein
MTRPSLIALAVFAALPALAQEVEIALPSGRIVTPHDMIEEEDTLRYRFLEPDLAMVIDFVPYPSLEADMRFLCESYALDLIEGGMPAQIFISIADRPVEFGTQDPDATQVFEAYRPEDGACIWEGF